MALFLIWGSATFLNISTDMEFIVLTRVGKIWPVLLSNIWWESWIFSICRSEMEGGSVFTATRVGGGLCWWYVRGWSIGIVWELRRWSSWQKREGRVFWQVKIRFSFWSIFMSNFRRDGSASVLVKSIIGFASLWSGNRMRCWAVRKKE